MLSVTSVFALVNCAGRGLWEACNGAGRWRGERNFFISMFLSPKKNANHKLIRDTTVLLRLEWNAINWCVDKLCRHTNLRRLLKLQQWMWEKKHQWLPFLRNRSGWKSILMCQSRLCNSLSCTQQDIAKASQCHRFSIAVSSFFLCPFFHSNLSTYLAWNFDWMNLSLFLHHTIPWVHASVILHFQEPWCWSSILCCHFPRPHVVAKYPHPPSAFKATFNEIAHVCFLPYMATVLPYLLPFFFSTLAFKASLTLDQHPVQS